MGRGRNLCWFMFKKMALLFCGLVFISQFSSHSEVCFSSLFALLVRPSVVVDLMIWVTSSA